jgi:hypothetical protein
MKKIIKRNTFKEAFADVLNLSHEELMQHSIDPFIEGAFNFFGQMDFSHESMNRKFTLDALINVHQPHRITNHNFNNSLYIKEIQINHISEIQISGISIYISDITGNFEENEVQQWLLAA